MQLVMTSSMSKKPMLDPGGRGRGQGDSRRGLLMLKELLFSYSGANFHCPNGSPHICASYFAGASLRIGDSCHRYLSFSCFASCSPTSCQEILPPHPVPPIAADLHSHHQFSSFPEIASNDSGPLALPVPLVAHSKWALAAHCTHSYIPVYDRGTAFWCHKGQASPS